jgi:tetratricopeptide (TPR) repeat protein
MARRLFLLFLVIAAAAAANAKTDTWLEVRTPHFVILSNSGERQARHVAGQFEQMRSVFQREFPNASIDGPSPIVVIAIRDKKEFQALEPEAYLAKGQLNLVGLFLQAPEKNYVLLRLDVEGAQPYATVYHEYTHFMMRRSQAWIPVWLNEGLAEFYQTTEMNDKEIGIGAPSEVNLMLLRQNRLLPLETLLTVDRNSPYYHEENKGSIFYAESWALVHYLQIKDRQDNIERLTDYTRLVSKNVDSLTAATKAFGDLKVLQKNLDKYVSQGSFYYFRVPGAPELNESSFKVQPLSTNQADAMRADFLVYNNRTKDARALLDRVLKEEPNNITAQEAMGLLAFREGNMAEAEKWYGQAVKQDSQSFLAHYYYAAIAMRENMSEDRVAQIESSLHAAEKLNPSFAPAFDQLASFYGMRDTNLEEAQKLSSTAVQLEPGNLNFRLHAANILAQMRRFKEAIEVLRAAMVLARDSQEVGEIHRELDSYQQYQAGLEQQEQFVQSSRQAQGESSSAQELTDVSATPLQAKDGPHGVRRTIRGTISDVRCFEPAILKLKVVGIPNPLLLHAVNYYQVEYSASGFTPKADMNPCRDLEGMKAKVDYFEGAGGSPEGQLVAIELAK